MEKLIISVGITGSRITRQQTPYIPITPEEIAQSGIEAWRAGASVLHVHVRDPKIRLGIQDISIFKEVVDRLRKETDAIFCLTTSGIPGRNLPIEERLKPLSLKPELVSFDAGSVNLGENAFLNPPEFLERLARETLENGIKPELEIFEVGMVYTCLRYLDLIITGKGMSSGYTPLGSVIVHERVYEVFFKSKRSTFFLGYTLSGNPLSCAS